MLRKNKFVTNSSSSNFIVWSKGDVTPAMVLEWGIIPRMETHKKQLIRKANLSPDHVAARINHFKYDLTPEWLEEEINNAELYIASQDYTSRLDLSTLDEEKREAILNSMLKWKESDVARLEELKQIRFMQRSGFKTYLYRCEDLAGYVEGWGDPLLGDKSEVGIAIHLLQHEDEWSGDNYSQARFNDTKNGGIRGLVFYLWPERSENACKKCMDSD